MEIPVSVSLGTVTLNGSVTVEEMICAADAALYRAKKAGRNRVVPAQVTPRKTSP